MENHDNIVLKVLLMKNGRTNNKRLHKIYEGKYPNILEYIDNRFPDMVERKEVFIRMRLKIEKRPVCPVCGGTLKISGNSVNPFFTYCSNKCKANSGIVRQKKKETCLLKYGVDNVSKLEVIKNKKKETCLEHYGVDNPQKYNKIRQKTINTCIVKYGVECSLKYDDTKEKIKQTCLLKYGTPQYLGSNNWKIKTTNASVNKYNSVWPSKSNYVKNKIKETCLLNFNKCSYVETDECKKLAHTNTAKNKRYETMKKNHTFNTSKPEEELYLYIKEKFPDVKRQYKDSIRYPWACDFYIPELDYFIELNGNWTHGKHPFSSTSKEDLYIVEEWKERSKEHPYYSNAIKTWTIYDVKKRNYAKEHNLNFKEVWSLEEGKDFIDSLQ